jgi:hypothetical protein
MCRQSCCDKSGGQGAGVAAVVLIIGAALVAAKIGPAVARVVHIALEVIRVVALITGMVVVFAVLAGATITITRWQLRRKAIVANQTRVVASPTIRLSPPRSSRPADCLACGDTGMVLRAISGSRYQPSECPVCEPARRVG